MRLLLAFLAAVCLTGLKSIQQQNVSYEKIWWIPPTSMLLSGFELYLWSKAPAADIGFWLAVGLGAGLGSIAAVLIHKRMRNATRSVNPRTQDR